MSEKTKFPNGFDCWHETHFEIVQAITIEWIKDEITGVVAQRQEEQGHSGLYELALELTNKFEEANKGVEWGVDDNTQYFDAIELFVNENL